MGQYRRPVKVGVLCTSLYVMSSANNVIAKTLMKTYPYPLTITLAHMMANAVFIYPVLMVAGLPCKAQTPHSLFLKFMLPLGIGKLISSLASHVSLWRVSVSYAHTVQATMPVFTVILARAMFRERHTMLVYLSLLPIVLGVGIATITEVSFDIVGSLSALLATVIFALQNIFSKSALLELQINPLHLLLSLAQIAFVICIPLWVLIDMPVMQHDMNLATAADVISYGGKLVLSGSINFGQNLAAFSVLNLLSPLSYSVMNAAKRVLVIVVSIVTLRNPVAFFNFSGMMIAVLGVFLYNRAKVLQNSDAKTVLSKSNNGMDDKMYPYLPRNRIYTGKFDSFV